MFYRFTRYFSTFFHSFLLFGKEELQICQPRECIVKPAAKRATKGETKRTINIPFPQPFQLCHAKERRDNLCGKQRQRACKQKTLGDAGNYKSSASLVESSKIFLRDVRKSIRSLLSSFVTLPVNRLRILQLSPFFTILHNEICTNCMQKRIFYASCRLFASQTQSVTYPLFYGCKPSCSVLSR